MLLKTIFQKGQLARCTAGNLAGQRVRLLAVFADIREANVESIEGAPQKVEKVALDDLMYIA